MNQAMPKTERCLHCRKSLDPDEPHWTTHADYYLMCAGAQKLSDLECQWSETIASYCPTCIEAFDVDRFVFEEPVPTVKLGRHFSQCSYCDDKIYQQGEYFFVLHVVEWKHADSAESMVAHSVTHAVICEVCDGAIDPLSAILPKKRSNLLSKQFPEPQI